MRQCVQGLWGEGKKSMWNGDYHLNINMQVCYVLIRQSTPLDSSELDCMISLLS